MKNVQVSTPFARRRLVAASLAVASLLCACGGGVAVSFGFDFGVDGFRDPSVVIEQPTTAPLFVTSAASVVLAGRAVDAERVEVHNTATGLVVNASFGADGRSQSWVSDTLPLVSGDNVVVVTAFAHASTGPIAQDTITIRRQAAGLALN